MLTHANFTSLVAALAPLFPLTSGDRVLSVLPLHHTFEFTCGMLLPFSRGARVVYLDELNGDRVAAGLKQARVTAMVGVPALWQLLERRILAQVAAKGPIAEKAFEIGAELNRMLGKTTGIDLGRILFGQVHEALGGNIRYLISGGAALPKDTAKLFAGLGLQLTEGYGLTEAAPVLTVAKPGSAAPGQVGKAIPGVDDQDRLARRARRRRGARARPQRHGRLHRRRGHQATCSPRTAGSTPAISASSIGSGRLDLVGRVKDVIVTSTGENVYPDDIERMLGKVAHVEELAIVGVTVGAAASASAASPSPRPTTRIDRAARLERAQKSLRDAISKLPYGKQPSIVHLYDAPLPRTATTQGEAHRSSQDARAHDRRDLAQRGRRGADRARCASRSPA